MGRLQGKIALVTGGASVPGLGSATALRFAQEGATLIVTDKGRQCKCRSPDQNVRRAMDTSLRRAGSVLWRALRLHGCSDH
jgi:NAD(P)-dependent dehydrogenase (short-subunit alcohol dehydrogenase family)